MNKIQQLIQQFCPDGVEWKELGDTCEIKTGKGITKNDGSDNALFPIISGGKVPMGYFHNFNRSENTVTISRVGANAGYVSFVSVKFYLNDKCFSIIPTIKNKHQFNTKFLFYFLKQYEQNIMGLQSEGGVPTINTTKISKIQVPIPPLPIQQEIVNILDKFTHLQAELQAELQARRAQYEYYRNELLNFEGNEVEWKTLGEVGVFVRGNGLQKKDFTESGVGCIHYGQIYTYYGTYTDKTKSFVSPEFAKKMKKAQRGDLIIATTSENVEDVCKTVVWLGNEEIAISGETYIFKHNENSKYLAYYLQTPIFLDFKKQNITGTKVIRVHGDKLKKFPIAIPPMAEQNRIAGILDKFDKLVNDISVGLPAEIEARRKQYEYYRGRLLEFKCLNR